MTPAPARADAIPFPRPAGGSRGRSISARPTQESSAFGEPISLASALGVAPRRRPTEPAPIAWRGSAVETPVGVRVLLEDPDLAAGMEPAQRRVAAALAVAPGFLLKRGRWDFFPGPDPAALGLLVIDGLLIVRIDTGVRAHAELLGPGDIISPWVGLGPDLGVLSTVDARVVSHLRVAMLDRAFALRIARWPEINAALIHRLMFRARRLSLQSAINSLPHTQQRLELTLWQLAYRFGRVTPAGYVLRLRLSHARFAEIVAATRPSVSAAFSRLQASGRVVRSEPGVWLLAGDPPDQLPPLARQAGLTT